MTESIDDYLKRLEELSDKATPGPWEQRCDNTLDNSALPKCVWSEFGFVSKGGDLPKQYSIPDAALITESRTAIPLLIALVRRYRKDLERVRINTEPGANFMNLETVAEDALALTLDDLKGEK